MQPTLSAGQDNITGTMERFAAESKRSFREVVLRAAKSVTRRVLAMTPPAHDNSAVGGLTGSRDAFAAGKARIARQMNALMAPRTLKGKRTVSQLFGRVLEQPRTYPTRERWPNVAGLYRGHLKVVGGRLKLSGFDGRVYYVDRTKYQTVLRSRQARVGRFASGWARAAAFLGVPVPSWVARHGIGRGTIRSSLLGSDMRITVQNLLSSLPPELRGEMRRRIGYALGYQRAAMQREIQFLVFKTSRTSGIPASMKGIVPEGMHGF